MTGLLAPTVGLDGSVGELGSIPGDIPPAPIGSSGSSPPVEVKDREARERFFICLRCWTGETCAREMSSCGEFSRRLRWDKGIRGFVNGSRV